MTAGYGRGPGALTPRMRDVLRAAARGASARETARELHVTEACVRTIRAAAIARMDAPNITAAVVNAYKAGEL